MQLAELTLQKGRRLRTKLVVGADGARSQVCFPAAIPSDLHLSKRADRQHAVCHLNIIGGTATIQFSLPSTVTHCHQLNSRFL